MRKPRRYIVILVNVAAPVTTWISPRVALKRRIYDICENDSAQKAVVLLEIRISEVVWPVGANYSS